MRYFTKEWYELMQHQFYTSGLKVVPEHKYSEQEIKEIYDEALQAEIDRERNTYGSDTMNANRKEWNQPGSQQNHSFHNHPPFDPTEIIDSFRVCYRIGLRNAYSGFPSWVRKTVDRRLLALQMIPEHAYIRLKKEETENRSQFQVITEAAQKELERQDIPDYIRSSFHFHDSYVLGLRKSGTNAILILRNNAECPEKTQYESVIFRNVHSIDREPGLIIRVRTENGKKCTNCRYLYEEIYQINDGYDVHMLFSTNYSLRYLTINCEDICFEESTSI